MWKFKIFNLPFIWPINDFNISKNLKTFMGQIKVKLNIFKLLQFFINWLKKTVEIPAENEPEVIPCSAVSCRAQTHMFYFYASVRSLAVCSSFLQLTVFSYTENFLKYFFPLKLTYSNQSNLNAFLIRMKGGKIMFFSLILECYFKTKFAILQYLCLALTATSWDMTLEKENDFSFD